MARGKAKRGKPDLGRGAVPPPPRVERSKKGYDRRREKAKTRSRIGEDEPGER